MGARAEEKSEKTKISVEKKSSNGGLYCTTDEREKRNQKMRGPDRTKQGKTKRRLKLGGVVTKLGRGCQTREIA